jgi:hypothetical protein
MLHPKAGNSMIVNWEILRALTTGTAVSIGIGLSRGMLKGVRGGNGQSRSSTLYICFLSHEIETTVKHHIGTCVRGPAMPTLLPACFCRLNQVIIGNVLSGHQASIAAREALQLMTEQDHVRPRCLGCFPSAWRPRGNDAYSEQTANKQQTTFLTSAVRCRNQLLIHIILPPRSLHTSSSSTRACQCQGVRALSFPRESERVQGRLRRNRRRKMGTGEERESLGLQRESSRPTVRADLG